jgi:hypothetical protein
MSELMVRTLMTVFVLSLPLVACKNRRYNSEAQVKEFGDNYFVTKGATIGLVFLKYDRSTYSFEANLSVLNEKSKYVGQELFCYNAVVQVYGYPGDLGQRLVNKFYSSDVGKIYCWENVDEPLKRKDGLQRPQGDIEFLSGVKCSVPFNTDKVKCTRLNWYDESGKKHDLYKGPTLAVGPVNGQPPTYADSQVSVKPGLKIDALMSFDGMTQFDGGDIYCRNKYLIKYTSYDIPYRYVKDAFATIGGIFTYVRCYPAKEELLATLDDDVKSGSRVNCPKVLVDNFKTQCTFVEEISK